jgi:hypothetical protein
MNNITTKNLAVAAIVAAILVVGGTFAATVTQSASAAAYDHKKGGGTKENGNTVTDQKDKQDGTASGFDTSFEEEGQNLICTHPANDAICSQEESAQTSTSTPQTCQECFTKFLTQPQINTIPQVSIAFVNCTFLVNFSESEFRTILINAGVDVTIANNLIACLRDVGIVFKV